jgi:hypothetical protein
MNTAALKRLRVNRSRRSALARSAAAPYHKRWFRRPRRRHDPILVFNMAIFNSASVRQCIFNSFPQRENVS